MCQAVESFGGRPSTWTDRNLRVRNEAQAHLHTACRAWRSRSEGDLDYGPGIVSLSLLNGLLHASTIEERHRTVGCGSSAGTSDKVRYCQGGHRERSVVLHHYLAWCRFIGHSVCSLSATECRKRPRKRQTRITR